MEKTPVPASDIEVLAVAKLSPFLTEPLHAAYTVHERLHETDPQAFAAVAPRIRAIAAKACGSVSCSRSCTV